MIPNLMIGRVINSIASLRDAAAKDNNDGLLCILIGLLLPQKLS